MQYASKTNEKMNENERLLNTKLNQFTFDCQIEPLTTNKRPTSVHALRPSDIEVIGAIGDSLTVKMSIFFVLIKVNALKIIHLRLPMELRQLQFWVCLKNVEVFHGGSFFFNLFSSEKQIMNQKYSKSMGGENPDLSKLITLPSIIKIESSLDYYFDF